MESTQECNNLYDCYIDHLSFKGYGYGGYGYGAPAPYGYGGGYGGGYGYCPPAGGPPAGYQVNVAKKT